MAERNKTNIEEEKIKELQEEIDKNLEEKEEVSLEQVRKEAVESNRQHKHEGKQSPKIESKNLIRNKETRVRGYAGSAQSVSHNTATKVQINTEVYDTRGEFSTTDYRFTGTMEGYYLVIGSVGWAGGDETGAEFSAYIYKNGSKISQASIMSVNYQPPTVQVSDLVYLEKDDYIELYCEQDSGGAIDTMNSSAQTYLSIIKLF